jgi:CheY-like chemotaxis protein
LRRIKLDDISRERLEEIKNAGGRAASLTRQLLAFSRKQVLKPELIEPNALVEGIGKMLRRLIGEDVEIVTVLRPEVGTINADPGQIEQVLINLVVNARDAMPDGGTITIETANVELDAAYAGAHIAVVPGFYVMLAVSDTGMGMDAETKKHIFEPFFTTKEVGKGTGLGLSMIYGIVKQSGGNIWVYSEIGKGTTFKIYLPRFDDRRKRKESNNEPLETCNGTETILVVEDEEMVRKLARDILEERGYRVLVAANGEEALRICAESDIHLMLTDVIMPSMNGRTLAERTSGRGLRVLYMSGYTDDAIIRHGVLEPGTNFLEKPFTPDALARKVKEVLNGKSSQ